jgi:hypothetical protein
MEIPAAVHTCIQTAMIEAEFEVEIECHHASTTQIANVGRKELETVTLNVSRVHVTTGQ